MYDVIHFVLLIVTILALAGAITMNIEINNIMDDLSRLEDLVDRLKEQR